MGLCLEWVGFRSDCTPYLPSLVALLRPFQRLHLCADYQASKVRQRHSLQRIATAEREQRSAGHSHLGPRAPVSGPQQSAARSCAGGGLAAPHSPPVLVWGIVRGVTHRQYGHALAEEHDSSAERAHAQHLLRRHRHAAHTSNHDLPHHSVGEAQHPSHRTRRLSPHRTSVVMRSLEERISARRRDSSISSATPGPVGRVQHASRAGKGGESVEGDDPALSRG